MVFRAQLQAFLIRKRARKASLRPVKFNVSGLKVRKVHSVVVSKIELGRRRDLRSLPSKSKQIARTIRIFDAKRAKPR